MNSKHVSIIALISIAGIMAGFAVTLIGAHDMTRGICVPTALQGAICPGSNILNSINFHLNGLRLFFSGNIMTILLAVFCALALALVSFPSLLKDRLVFAFQRFYGPDSLALATRKQAHYLALKKKFEED